jgi:hypothetical protein
VGLQEALQALPLSLGIDGNGDKHPLGLVEGATEERHWRLTEGLVPHSLR